ncbi:Mediator of RNA polymerase II transcription subunit 7 [Abortiporus biennis]
MDDEEAELRNPFPSPPSHYNNYTTHNLKLLELLKERVTTRKEEAEGEGGGEEKEKVADLTQVNQHEILSDQTDIPDWPLIQLEKPRADWILEEGHYTVFGDTWFVKEVIPSLGEQGGHQLYPVDPSVDRRPALLSILKSLLVTYSKLTKSLLAPPPTSFTVESPQPEWQRDVEWITVLAQNIMAAANDLRPVQARGNLELMMRRQLDLRKEETRALHEKCDSLEARLEELRISSQQFASVKDEAMDISVPTTDVNGTASTTGIQEPSLTSEDVLRWSEEIG